VEVYVFTFSDAGVMATQFSAPKPACMAGATYLADLNVFPVTLGNSQSGVSIGFGQCETYYCHVLTIQYFMTGATVGCCPYWVLPHPNAESGKVEFVDCAQQLFFGTPEATYVSNTANSPPLVGNPEPNPGALQQALDTKLDWTVFRCDCLMSISWNRVYFGTTPDPPLVNDWVEENHYDPGLLQPNTTYYWKLQTFAGSSLSTTTPVWSFSTVTGVATEPTSWGRIKSLYR